MKELYGVWVGARVKDLLGNDLGRVKAVYQGAFLVSKGFPWLFREDRVIRYDEIRNRSDGSIAVARDPGDLFTLAKGELPDSWKVEPEPGMKIAATPSEAAPVLGSPSGRDS